jgi:hypothetical protein
MHPLGERRSPGQVSRVLGTVRVMDLEADDLAAVEVEDQVEIEPASLDGRRQERQILSANSGKCQCDSDMCAVVEWPADAIGTSSGST